MSWPIERLGNVADVLSGFAFKSEFFNSERGMPLIRIRDVVPGHTSTLYTGPYTPEFVIQNNEILIGMDGEFNCGKWSGGAALLNQRVCRIKPRGTKLDQNFLWHFLPRVLKEIEGRTPFVTVKHLSSKELINSQIALPPLPEQRRIAAILDHADALRAKRRAAIAKLDSLAQAIFLEMFGDCHANPYNWPTTHLSDVIVSGPQNGLYKPAHCYGSGIPIVRIDSFYDGVVTNLLRLKRVQLSDEERELYRLSEGDIVVNRVNSLEYLGKSAIIPSLSEATVFESNMMRFRVDSTKLLPDFLVTFLQSSYVKSQILGRAKNAVNQSSINQEDVRSLDIFLPPITRQTQYLKKRRSFGDHSLLQSRSMRTLDALFSSLQYRAFQGDL